MQRPRYTFLYKHLCLSSQYRTGWLLDCYIWGYDAATCSTLSTLFLQHSTTLILVVGRGYISVSGARGGCACTMCSKLRALWFYRLGIWITALPPTHSCPPHLHLPRALYTLTSSHPTLPNRWTHLSSDHSPLSWIQHPPSLHILDTCTLAAGELSLDFDYVFFLMG